MAMQKSRTCNVSEFFLKFHKYGNLDHAPGIMKFPEEWFL